MKKLIVGIDLAKEGGDITVLTHIRNGVIRNSECDEWQEVKNFMESIQKGVKDLSEPTEDIDCQVVDSILKK
jgi:hypothetical protein